jgi:SAM-dependent methyltransferase
MDIGMLDVTNRFVLDFARRYARENPGLAMLDYGCGAGALVAAARREGLPMQGADVFYAGSDARAQAEAAGLRGAAIHEIHGARLPFPNAAFGLVVNNQVMEHVEDLDAVLAEIHRVLRPGGVLLSLFPSRDVWREGHIGIPFSHWFRPGSRARFFYTWALRAAGLGYWKEQSPTAKQWALDKLQWIDTFTRYRSRAEIFAAFARYFASETRELDYVRFRLLDAPGRAWIARLLQWKPAGLVARALFRKLAFFVILSRKEPA